MQTTVIAAQARLCTVRLGSGVGGGTVHPEPATHVFLRISMRDPARVRAFRHLASDSPPCACPIDLPRAQALGQELFFGDQKGLPLSSRSKIRANGCRGEVPKKLQSGRPVSRSFGGLSLCSRFWTSPSVACFTCSWGWLGARVLRAPVGAQEHAFYGALEAQKGVQRERPFGGT